MEIDSEDQDRVSSEEDECVNGDSFAVGFHAAELESVVMSGQREKETWRKENE